MSKQDQKNIISYQQLFRCNFGILYSPRFTQPKWCLHPKPLRKVHLQSRILWIRKFCSPLLNKMDLCWMRKIGHISTKNVSLMDAGFIRIDPKNECRGQKFGSSSKIVVLDLLADLLGVLTKGQSLHTTFLKIYENGQPAAPGVAP